MKKPARLHRTQATSRDPSHRLELSVRSRNCLRKMNIRTLGDLTRTTEAALLSSKNFGETSLAEIKDMMHAKGLRLGMSLEGSDAAPTTTGSSNRRRSPRLQAIMNKPIGDLNLSVRARKCMSKLNIQTVGDILKHTGDELPRMQKLRRHFIERGARQASGAQLETQKRLIPRLVARGPLAGGEAVIGRAELDFRLHRHLAADGRPRSVQFDIAVAPAGPVYYFGSGRRLGRAIRPAPNSAWVRADARLHAGRHPGHGQGSHARAD